MSWKQHLTAEEREALESLKIQEAAISKQRLKIRKRAWAEMLRERAKEASQ